MQYTALNMHRPTLTVIPRLTQPSVTVIWASACVLSIFYINNEVHIITIVVNATEQLLLRLELFLFQMCARAQ